MSIQSPIGHRRHTMGLIAASSVVALALGAAGCSESDEQGPARSGSAEMQPESFTFAPPDGARGVRTENRRYEASLVGAPLRNLEERELRWNVESKRNGDQFVVTQELAHVTMKHDGETLVDKDVKPGAVVAQLIIDKAGNLVDVRGLEGASKALMVAPSPDARPGAAPELSPQTLKALVATRYEETLGDIVGRPTKAGTSWTTQGRPGGPVISRTVTVQKTEPCGATMCTGLQAIYKLNPRLMLSIADQIVGEYARMIGKAPSKVDVQTAMYSMQGTLLTEPATMMNHGATLDETGKILFEGPKKQPMEIDLQGRTLITFEYAKPVASESPSLPGVPAAAPVAARP
ncbi:MAG TPA: hypothetical protein VK762_30450 [Polyangiaceae bacterium]|jgi:hypothetical protein|nr:hypothetical protein [Polyangiaceae bacterium]